MLNALLKGNPAQGNIKKLKYFTLHLEVLNIIDNIAVWDFTQILLHILRIVSNFDKGKKKIYNH